MVVRKKTTQPRGTLQRDMRDRINTLKEQRKGYAKGIERCDAQIDALEHALTALNSA